MGQYIKKIENLKKEIEKNKNEVEKDTNNKEYKDKLEQFTCLENFLTKFDINEQNNDEISCSNDSKSYSDDSDNGKDYDGNKNQNKNISLLSTNLIRSYKLIDNFFTKKNFLIFDKQIKELLISLENEYKEIKYLLENINSIRKRRITKNEIKNHKFLEKNEEILNQLQNKIKKLENDKIKIQKTIQNLNILSNKQLKKALEFINKEFKVYLRMFFKNIGNEVEGFIDDNFNLKIKIENWKTLNELSGGQRSLVILSLLFSSLNYNPSPFYLFDEIDSALDINHTTNLSEVFKYLNTQFIIISLKPEFIKSSNRVLKVFIQDNKSKIAIVKN